MRGQLSVELLVVLVIILGLVVLVASTMMKSANKASEKVGQKTDSVLNSTYEGGTVLSGDYCVHDTDCRAGRCDTYSRKCF